MENKEDKKINSQILEKEKPSKEKKGKVGIQKKGRLLKGIVISDKMEKTVTVLVNRYKKHSKYKKRYKVSKKYKAHDEENSYKVGDRVVIQESRPISKNKKWAVVKKGESAKGGKPIL